MSTKTKAIRALTAAALVGACVSLAAGADAATSQKVPTWTGGAPLPATPNLGLKRNQDGEPGMGVAPDGQFWIASDVAPYAADDPRASSGLLSGADVWTSTNGGRSYHWVADPFRTSEENPGLAGEDTDLAVAPVKNDSGHYTVYATSLWLGASSLAWSEDGGATWSTIALGGVPAQDRPWLAAAGPCSVYLTYHQLPSFTPFLNKYDVCDVTDTGAGATLDPVESTNITLSIFPGLTNAFGKHVIDNSKKSKFRGNIYVPMAVCTVEDPSDLVFNAESQSGCPKNTEQAIAVSTDDGKTFHDYHVATSPNEDVLVWPNTVATDGAGAVYFVWSDNHHSYLNISKDAGKTWTKSRRLDVAPSRTAVYPTVAGGAADHVDVAWYGTAKTGDANDPKVMGEPSKSKSTPWYVYDARSYDGGATFTQTRATGVVHRGELCTHGSGCGDTNSRNLLDDFGVSISPKTGLTAITYTSDQPQGEAGTAFTGFTTMTSAPDANGSGGVRGSHVSSGRAAGDLATTGGLPWAGIALLFVVAAVALHRRAGTSAPVSAHRRYSHGSD